MSGRDDVRDLARALRDPGDLDLLLDRIGDARVVLLGEASHGTHEYYAWRTAITRRLVEEHGFSFVAVEGDRPDCQRVHRSVTLASATDDPREVLRGDERRSTNRSTSTRAGDVPPEVNRTTELHSHGASPACPL